MFPGITGQQLKLGGPQGRHLKVEAAGTHTSSSNKRRPKRKKNMIWRGGGGRGKRGNKHIKLFINEFSLGQN